MTRPLASIGDRFTAQFIDGLAAIGIGAGLFYLAKAFGWPLQFAILGWLAYLILCDAMPRGQSIGKRLIRIAVVHVETERPCNLWRSILRNVPMITLGVVDAVFIVGKQRRRLGDFLARTKVVSAAV